ncbi:mitochondrial import receptor subunit Tom22p [[Candida] jaroonii]|uniref:Mitochondrial import receptor subunit Tom22p n=1 Tax=[Candida] jaroonii TaxID=467808 RepID=A0ACA9Y3Z7_9ASCO|nr:mitochondrial import receptor subunit Tom22p [[Candida] jaroonii]
MVKLTQIDETKEPELKEVYTDSESDSEIEDDFNEDETLYERIVALKDIIPPEQRTNLMKISSNVSSTLNWGLSKSGNILWTLTSSILLLGVPLSLAIISETQLQEMENNLNLQDGKEILTGEEKK